MDYIVLDLEWNQAAYKIDEEAEIPFEIIEIGAVKLNSSFEKVGEFQELIRPQVYPFLVRRTRELTGWRDRDLDERGIYFEDACAKFLEWCGKNYIFCVWGSSDLVQLERNMAYFDIKIPWKYPFKYLDVQKLYALQENEGKTRRALEYVIEKYELPADRPFHHAVDDAAYTAMVFQRIDHEAYDSYYSVDYYRIPKNRFEEATFRFDTYTKYVSRSFPLKEEVINDRRVKELTCFECRKRLKKTIPWFSDSGRSYLALGECKEHGLMRGRIRIKTAENFSGYFAVRTIKPCTEEYRQIIEEKRENLSAKRREKRKRERKKGRDKEKEKEQTAE
ncbi:MAG: exonuclease domain-containing protein [Lachnospiraceae bacterium]|nr:exonuclease domain-containing protein [Lachnospiraceae bacterium]